MKYVNSNIISATNTGTVNSTVVDANQIISSSFHAYFSDGAAAGTLKLQASNDVAQSTSPTSTPTHWVDIPNASATVTSGSPAIIFLSQQSYRWMRAVWTSSAGAGTINVNMQAFSV